MSLGLNGYTDNKQYGIVLFPAARHHGHGCTRRYAESLLRCISRRAEICLIRQRRIASGTTTEMRDILDRGFLVQ